MERDKQVLQGIHAGRKRGKNLLEMFRKHFYVLQGPLSRARLAHPRRRWLWRRQRPGFGFAVVSSLFGHLRTRRRVLGESPSRGRRLLRVPERVPLRPGELHLPAGAAGAADAGGGGISWRWTNSEEEEAADRSAAASLPNGQVEKKYCFHIVRNIYFKQSLQGRWSYWLAAGFVGAPPPQSPKPEQGCGGGKGGGGRWWTAAGKVGNGGICNPRWEQVFFREKYNGIF